MNVYTKMKMIDTGKILHNRFVLYFILFLALTDLLYLAMGGEYTSVAVFILSGFVTSFFSKNMMVVMCIAMVITNILKYGTDIRMQEGAENPKPDEENHEESEDKKQPVEVKEEKVKATEKKSDETKKPKEFTITEEEKRKFTENMEKLGAYEPLFTSMDRLLEKINDLISS